jgi:ATP-dependent RNA helicase RhlE
MSFETLGLAESLLRAVREKGYSTATPVQQQAIPAILLGQDIMAAAQTGTGKTAGFTLPMLQRLMAGERAKSNHVRALVLTPTRELAAQVQDNVRLYGQHLPLRTGVVFGGVSINPQMQLVRRGVDVLVATPGRLLDLYQQNAIKFQQLEILVLDEADRMLDMGFIHDIKRILKLLPAKRQTLMFSATFSGDIRELAKGMLNQPVEIDVSPRNTTTHLVEQIVHTVDKARKPALLTHLIQSQNWQQALVFSRTKHGANKLVDHLTKQGILAAAIHGNKSQTARTKALSDFKSGKVCVLVATDIAARGLDIEQLPQVVNMDLPNVPEDYVHRIGRTGRAGATGHAISLVSADEASLLADIEKLIKRKLPRSEVDGYEALHAVPEARASKASRPRQQSGANSRSSGARDNTARNADPRSSSDRNGGGRDGNTRSTGNSDNANRGNVRSSEVRSNEVRSSETRSNTGRSNPGNSARATPGVNPGNAGQRPPTRTSKSPSNRTWKRSA